MSFYSLLTSIGAARLTTAQATGVALDIVSMAVGDGNGSDVTPLESMTSLVNEVWRGSVSSLAQDADNPAWLIIEAVIPAAVGGWTARELGVFDAAGNLIAVGNFPATYKPDIAEGSARDLSIKLIMETSSANSVSLLVDPSITVATHDYVAIEIGKVITANELAFKAIHLSEASAHTSILELQSQLAQLK